MTIFPAIILATLALAFFVAMLRNPSFVTAVCFALLATGAYMAADMVWNFSGPSGTRGAPEVRGTR